MFRCGYEGATGDKSGVVNLKSRYLFGIIQYSNPVYIYK